MQGYGHEATLSTEDLRVKNYIKVVGIVGEKDLQDSGGLIVI